MTPRRAADRGLDLNDEIGEFERLRERAHEQIAALSATVAQLERLRSEIEAHLPGQRRTAAYQA